MKTAYDVMERLSTLNEYLDALRSGMNSVSTFNEEFGEGNPEVGILGKLSGEVKQERDELVQKLKSVEVK